MDKVNHFEFNHSAKKIAFLYRFWIKGIKHTNMVVYNIEKDELLVIGNEPFYSHFCWLNNEEILVFGSLNGVNSFFLINVNKFEFYNPEFPVPKFDHTRLIQKK